MQVLFSSNRLFWIIFGTLDWDQATVMPQRDSAIIECPKMSGGLMSNWSSCEATVLF